MRVIAQKAELLNDFARWFGLTGISFDSERRQGDLGRLLHYLPSHIAAIDEQQLIAYVNHPDEELEPEAQRLLNIRKALQFCRVAEEPHGIPLLQKIHNILLNKLPAAANAARLRTDGDNPDASRLNVLAEDFTSLANDKNTHPLIRVWILYYFLTSARFFDAENDTLAIIFSYYFMQREGYNYRHLLKLEKYILHSKKYMAYSINYLENKKFDALLRNDLSSYLQICMQGFDQNLDFVKEMYHAAVKKRLEYSQLTPRQKNAVNYWLEKGFPMHRHRLNDLNVRQRDMLFRLYTDLELSTSEAAVLYNADRKTIQDDLTPLLQMGIAILKGSGKDMRFGLNFQ